MLVIYGIKARKLAKQRNDVFDRDVQVFLYLHRHCQAELSITRIFLVSIKFWETKILAKNRNFGQNSKLWSKIYILVKTRNCGQKSKFWSKIEILVKNRNLGQKIII